MRLLDETRSRGKHSVLLLAESASDKHVLSEFSRVLREHPVLTAEMVQNVRDRWPTLRIEEMGK